MALPVRRNGAGPARWDPLAELGRLHAELSSYLDGWADLPRLGGEGFVPLADVEESDDAYTVEVELPSVRREDVTVEMAGRRLTVTGERKERQRVGILRKRTRSVGRFHYEVTLPGKVDEDGVVASMDEGILTVRVPKAASERARRIAVT